MKTLSSLDEVTQYLTQHENALRIKKLIFCACKNTWENDQNKLNSFDLLELIRELVYLNPTIDSLRASLSKVVKSLNKQAEYSVLASIVFNTVKRLYEEEQVLTQVVKNNSSASLNSALQSNLSLTPSYQSKPLINKVERDYNPFELRQEIMKYTNPLRAKILIYSTLYENFSFSEQDWSKLRKYQLDDLLLVLFNACPSLKDFEDKLNTTANYLQDHSENTQAASAIAQAIRPYYNSVDSNINQINVLNVNLVDDSYEEDDDDLNTCQLIPPTNIFKPNY